MTVEALLAVIALSTFISSSVYVYAAVNQNYIIIVQFGEERETQIEVPFKFYIRHTIYQALNQFLKTAASLIWDIAKPIHIYQFGEEGAEPSWLLILLITAQLNLILMCNIMAILFFLPLEILAQRIRPPLERRT